MAGGVVACQCDLQPQERSPSWDLWFLLEILSRAGGRGHSGEQMPYVKEFAQKVKVVCPGVEELSQAASLTPITKGGSCWACKCG